MEDRYVELIQKEAMWAKMLMQVLEDHKIPCAAMPVLGAGFTARTGMQEILKVYVPEQYLSQASEWVQALFSAEFAEE